MNTRKLLVALRLTLLLPLVALSIALSDCSDVPEGWTKVLLGELLIEAEIADSPEERTQGLSGRETLAEDAGMLFVFEQEQLPAFWMRDVRFPLDFVWISADKEIVDLTADVPPPAADTPDDELVRYRPAAPVLYVLEVNAGVIARAGVTVGDAVQFEVDGPTNDGE